MNVPPQDELLHSCGTLMRESIDVPHYELQFGPFSTTPVMLTVNSDRNYQTYGVHGKPRTRNELELNGFASRSRSLAADEVAFAEFRMRVIDHSKFVVAEYYYR